MLIILASYIAFFIVCVLLLNRHGTNQKQDNILWFLLALALATVAYCFDPSGTGLDVVRHFQRIELIEQSGVSFGRFMFKDSLGYNGLYVFNAFCYFIAKTGISEHILPFAVTLISYLICFYILRDWTEREAISRKCYGLSLLVGFAFLPYYFVMCGIRNGVAMCIIALALYLYLYRKKGLFLFVGLIVLAATIHVSVLIVVPFVILSRISLNLKGLLLVIAGSFALETMTEVLSKENIPYLSGMAKSYLVYSSDAQFRSAQYFLITDIILILIFAVLLVSQYNQYLAVKNKGSNVRLYNFIAFYGSYIIGNFGNYDLVLRPSYLFGPLAPMLIFLLYNNDFWRGKRLIQLCLKAAVALICGYTVSRYMVYFFSIVSFA